MPFSRLTLSQFAVLVSQQMDDPLARYWTVPEIYYATGEGLRVWGAYTNYWRARGTFNLIPNPAVTPYYDLSVLLPTLRPRIWNLNQIVQEIQYMLLEAANGIAGTGMSGQVSVGTIIESVLYARQRFVLDAHIPITINPQFADPAPPDGSVSFDQKSVYVHRVSWQDNPSGVWTNLWRSDGWDIDHNNPLWTIQPGMPQVYSEAEISPLKLQLAPPPVNEGLLEAMTVDATSIDITSGASTLNVPDEWSHAIKYAALNQILSSEGEIKDEERAQYADLRYQQAIKFAQDARSILRVMLNGVPLQMDSLAALDAAQPYWRNQTGRTQQAGALYDIIVPYPGVPDQAYSIAADVVQAAPLPMPGDYLQIGDENIDHLVSYVCHVLSFKCGGNEFKSSMSAYDEFMKAIAMRKGVDKAKIKYLTPIFGVGQAEEAVRPDEMVTK